MTKHCSQKNQLKNLGATAEMQWLSVLGSTLYIIVDMCVTQTMLIQNDDCYI